jgi:hypothetical protein
MTKRFAPASSEGPPFARAEAALDATAGFGSGFGGSDFEQAAHAKASAKIKRLNAKFAIVFTPVPHSASKGKF